MVDKTMDSFSKLKNNVEGGKLGKQADTIKQKHIDLARTFKNVFDTPEGKLVLEHLDYYSHINFPNYDNVYATYSKAGEQTLVKYIDAMIKLSKKE